VLSTTELRARKGAGLSEGGIRKRYNKHTHTDAKSNMTALIGLLLFSLSISLVLSG